jgi:hypothetical protein
VGSDHSPLILDSGEKRESRSSYFYFQEKWFFLEGFRDLVHKKWVDKLTTFFAIKLLFG